MIDRVIQDGNSFIVKSSQTNCDETSHQGIHGQDGWCGCLYMVRYSSWMKHCPIIMMSLDFVSKNKVASSSLHLCVWVGEWNRDFQVKLLFYMYFFWLILQWLYRLDGLNINWYHRHIEFCVKRVDHILSYGIKKVVLVFDGRQLPSKLDTENNREK